MESKSANDRNDEWTCDWSQSCPIYDKGKRSETLPCMRCLAEPKERVGEAKLARRLRSYLKRLLVTLGTTDAPHDATPRELADCLNGLVRDLYATYAAGWADSDPRPFGVVTGCACLDAGLFPLGRPAYLCLPPEPGKDTARILNHKGYLLENLLRVVADRELPPPKYSMENKFASVYSLVKNSSSAMVYVTHWGKHKELTEHYRGQLLDASTRQALESVPDRVVQVFWGRKAGTMAFDDYNIVFSPLEEAVKSIVPSHLIVLVAFNDLRSIVAKLAGLYSSDYSGKMLMLPCCLTEHYQKQAEDRIPKLQETVDADTILKGNVRFLPPIILPRNARAKIPDVKGPSLETLVAALEDNPGFKNPGFKMAPPHPEPALPKFCLESPKAVVVSKVMELLEWQSNSRHADMEKYAKRVERLFRLEYPIIYLECKELKLPDFFAKRSQVAPERQNWHVKPNAKDRHKFNNASYLLALMLAKIDYAIAPETVSEKSIQAEAIGVRRALNRLFELNGRRITGKGRRKTDALPKNAPRLMTLKAWLENHIDHHARKWPPETQEAFDSAFTPDEAGKIFHVDHGEKRILIEFVRPNF